ncbi:MAG TPA: GNAT family N-acetyltransferase [Gaiellaceae bacterium]|nr:GNAT family N-acetyltransferase [Gaiellaceae bacterium]
MKIVPFTDEHVDAAAELLAARHERHRAAEPLLPGDVDFRAEVEKEWAVDGASGVISADGYVFGAPARQRWFSVGVCGHAVSGDAEHARDLYAAAAGAWAGAGHSSHVVFLPASDPALIDAWFRLSFGASGALGMRETDAEPEPYDGGVRVRQGTRDDFDAAASLEVTLHEALLPSPSFSDLTPQSREEAAAEWRADTDDEKYELFVAERDGRIVGHVLLYRRPPDLRVPPDSIDLAQASTEPAARGTGVGRALTAHAIRWAHEHGYPAMTIDWRMTNLWASRFWPRRGFRTSFLRLHRWIG